MVPPIQLPLGNWRRASSSPAMFRYLPLPINSAARPVDISPVLACMVISLAGVSGIVELGQFVAEHRFVTDEITLQFVSFHDAHFAIGDHAHLFAQLGEQELQAEQADV